MKPVFIDVDTQLDFLFPGGALYVPGAEKIAPSLIALTSFAAESEIPIVSTVDAHLEDDNEFRTWKPHCVVGTQGQQKFSGSVCVARPHLQTVVSKNKIDVFTGSKLDEALAGIPAGPCIVYGVVTEYCVQSAVFGLLSRGRPVEVVTDAIQSLDAVAGRSCLESFSQRGARLTTVKDVLALKRK